MLSRPRMMPPSARTASTPALERRQRFASMLQKHDSSIAEGKSPGRPLQQRRAKFMFQLSD